MSKEPDDVIDCMARMKGDGQPFAVATVVHVHGGASAREGSKAVIRGDGRVIGWIGGGCTLSAVKKNRVPRAERRPGPFHQGSPERRLDHRSWPNPDGGLR